MTIRNKNLNLCLTIIADLLKIAGIIILIFLLLIVIWDQKRSFYQLSDNQNITVWKRWGGKCYITFDKYYGIFTPSDFIMTPNNNALTIIYDNSSNEYVISNDFNKKVKINLPDKKIKYFEYAQRDSFINKYYTNGMVRDSLKYMQIDIKELDVTINEIEQ